MKFNCSLVVVADVFRARRLYEGILHQKVLSDFGEYNVSFEGGLAFYNKNLYQSLVGADRSILQRAHNFELYFEGDHLEELAAEIQRGGYEVIHGIREEPWKQRAFRFYDEDHHIVALAEGMDEVSRRLAKEGKTVAEITALTGLPAAEIQDHVAGE